MREIKFRLRNCFDKIVGYEKWYSGSLDSKNFYTAQPCWLYSKDGKDWYPIPIQHRYKNQYTGLKDKNSKEIYEGDILKDYAGTIKEVFYKNTGFLTRFHPKLFKMTWMRDRLHGEPIDEVIGNMYENSELLET